MAINITVPLNDAEQALVTELALKIAPGATQPQVIAWVVKQCRKGLREAVISEWNALARVEAGQLVVSRETRSATDFPEVI